MNEAIAFLTPEEFDKLSEENKKLLLDSVKEDTVQTPEDRGEDEVLTAYLHPSVI